MNKRTNSSKEGWLHKNKVCLRLSTLRDSSITKSSDVLVERDIFRLDLKSRNPCFWRKWPTENSICPDTSKSELDPVKRQALERTTELPAVALSGPRQGWTSQLPQRCLIP